MFSTSTWLWFESQLGLFCVECARCPRARGGLLWFPPTVRNMLHRWAMGACEWVALSQSGIQGGLRLHPAVARLAPPASKRLQQVLTMDGRHLTSTIPSPSQNTESDSGSIIRPSEPALFMVGVLGMLQPTQPPSETCPGVDTADRMMVFLLYEGPASKCQRKLF